MHLTIQLAISAITGGGGNIIAIRNEERRPRQLRKRMKASLKLKCPRAEDDDMRLNELALWLWEYLITIWIYLWVSP